MQCSAVLLAGGKSSRMGRDKALLEFGGRPLWQHQLETLRRLSPAQLLLSGPARNGIEGVPDEMEDAGPLGGIASALKRTATPLLVVLAVDLPYMTSELLGSLLAKCQADCGIVPCSRGRLEPLAAVYPVLCASLAVAALEQGKFSVQDWVRSAFDRGFLRTREILPNEKRFFLNLNTPEDYARAQHGEID
jgi:molybdopterin-guanine dinucleotide biosynthesis protein A